MTTARLPRRARKKRVEIDPTRIGRLLRLALSSDQDGEVIAAVGALKRAMSSAGIDLDDVAACAKIVTQDVGFVCRTRQEYLHAIPGVNSIPPDRCRAKAMNELQYTRMAADYAREYNEEIASATSSQRKRKHNA
ncbi:hypothetical protein JQ625_20425 [Bradyrhizobium diazoefficiens]|nr:hypothetical protein [Bradyrhizobium diazoefficiens]MBR0777213.1 hypothetical protein [Bradyrhizobium diazoefficiens]